MTKAADAALRQYLDILEISRPAIERTRAAWQILAPEMPALIDEFFESLFAKGYHPAFAGKSIDKIKAGQLAYWARLFAGGFEMAVGAHAQRIGMKHRDANIGVADYVASYAWFSGRFFQIIARSTPPPRYRRDELLDAVNRLIYLDIIIALDENETVDIAYID